jgi:hypothetical protein
MSAFRERQTLAGMRVEKEENGIVFLRCGLCQCSYPVPKGFEDGVTCQAPGCLGKRRA